MKFKLFLLLFFVVIKNNAQEKEFSRNSIKTSIGLAANSGIYEEGFGVLYSFGYQRNFGKKEKLRLHSSILNGSFSSRLSSDVPDVFYTLTSVDLNLDFDFIKAKEVSLFSSIGGFYTYSRGLMGTGGESGRTSSHYFGQNYYGFNFGGGLRINPKKSRLAFELKPFNFQIGVNKEYLLFSPLLMVDIKL